MDKLKEENEKLKEENEKLKEENEKLKELIFKYGATLSLLKEQGINKVEIPYTRLLNNNSFIGISFEDDVIGFKKIIKW